MAQDSKIEWCDHTANLWWGCVEVHEGCDHCYAKAWAKRYQPQELWGLGSVRMQIKGVWDDLAMFQRKAAREKTIHRVFVGSMMDIAEQPATVIDRHGNSMDYTTDAIRRYFFEQVVPACPNLLFLLLTKRPSNFNKVIPENWITNPPANVMFGTSVVNMATYKTLVPQLRKVNGRRFLSIEPQLDYIHPDNLAGIDWVIQGGESGPKRRPFNLDWARSMRDDCQLLNVPYFFKQIDKIQQIPADLQIRQFPLQAQLTK